MGMFEEQEKALQAGLIKAKQMKADENKARSSQLVGEASAARDADLSKGRARGEEMFSEGSLGRVGEEQSSAIKDVMARRQAGLSGLNAEENNALRDQALQGISQQEQTAMRQLRGVQGATGVRGGLAGAQQAQVLSNSQAARGNAERDLFLKNIDAKNQALGAFESSARSTDADALDKAKFNLDQKNREKFAQQATELGYGQLGSTDRAAVNARLVGEAQAESAAQQSQGKK